MLLIKGPLSLPAHLSKYIIEMCRVKIYKTHSLFSFAKLKLSVSQLLFLFVCLFKNVFLFKLDLDERERDACSVMFCSVLLCNGTTGLSPVLRQYVVGRSFIKRTLATGLTLALALVFGSFFFSLSLFFFFVEFRLV